MAFANLFYGVTPSAGQLGTSFAEAASIPATTPYTITVANAANFIDDEGVLLRSVQVCHLTKVASAPSAGQYSIASGVVTFNSADAGKAVLISYTYTAERRRDKSSRSPINLLGTTPTFQAVFYTTFQGQAISLKLNNCTSSKLSFQTKLEDFVMPEFDFSCFADAAGNVMTWSFAEAS